MKPILLSAVLILAASACSAGTLQPWVGASGSFNTYAMDAVNEDIGGINTTLAPATMDEIASGIGYGVSVGAALDRWSFSLGYERLPATSILEYNGVSTGFGYDIAGDALLVRGVYRVSTNPGFAIGIGIGAGIVSASGEIGSTGDPILRKIGASTNAIIYGRGLFVEGTDACFEGFFEGDVALGGKFALVPSVGYRSAKVDADATAGAASGSQTIDYSGLAAHVGLRYGF